MLNQSLKIIALLSLPFAISACSSDDASFCNESANSCTFVLYSESADELTVVNPQRAATQFTPASTFKIANSLIALETGVLTGTEELLSVDLDRYPAQSWWRPDWITQSFDLRGAFQNSVFPIYQSIASEIGDTRMAEYLQRFDYGNQDISSGIDIFWVAGSLEISALQQIDFLQNVYHNNYSLRTETLNGLREIMLVEETNNYVMYAKTGAALLDESSIILWYVGFIESSEGVHYFAFNIHASPAPENAQRRRDLTRSYLQHFEII